MTYEEYLQQKALTAPPVGIADPGPMPDYLSGFQQDVGRWLLRRGRGAGFLDTGLGKTRLQLMCAEYVAKFTGKPSIIMAPLAVSGQTVREAESIGIQANLCRGIEHLGGGVNVTNYDIMHKFDPSMFGCVLLDESSILKDFTSATRNAIIDAFKMTPFRFAFSATPAPNDFTELGNHAEFFGILTRAEMLSTWFVHDGGSTQDWRLKGHAEEDFWRWVTSWAAMVKRPSDLGYSDEGYDLPPLEMIDVVCPSSNELARAAGLLFIEPASSLSEQRVARRVSLDDRVQKCADIVNASEGPFLVWCELNDEGDALTRAIDGAVQIAGKDLASVKERRMLDFSEGRTRVLVTKPSIAGYGMNWQHCAQMAFVGVSHSWEKFYQAVRRCWRFGQRFPVRCYVITSEAEGAIGANLRRKEADAVEMAARMSKYTAELTRANVRASKRETTPYHARAAMRIPAWLSTYAEEG